MAPNLQEALNFVNQEIEWLRANSPWWTKRWAQKEFDTLFSAQINLEEIIKDLKEYRRPEIPKRELYD